MNRALLLFKALSDETRYKILELLIEGERCVCEIYPKVDRTQSTVSLQLGKLEDWEIVESRREGKKIYYSLKDLTVCDLFKAVGNKKGHILKKNCCKG
ncbi:MAG: metalloregulator ArsR/SmtB family transcription factor [Candidatus Woesearchaeota archaeon]